MKVFYLIVAGGRDFNDYECAKAEIKRLCSGPLADYNVAIVSGMARGADALGVRFAREFNLPLHEFPADWDRYGKRAGYLRNEQMAEFAHGLLAFWDGHSRGTKHMIDIAKAKGLSHRTVSY